MLNLWVLVAASRLALKIGKWLVLQRISEIFECACVGFADVVGFDYWGLLALQEISKNPECAGVGSTIWVGFVIIWAWLYYKGFPKVLNLQVVAPPS